MIGNIEIIDDNKTGVLTANGERIKVEFKLLNITKTVGIRHYIFYDLIRTAENSVKKSSKSTKNCEIENDIDCLKDDDLSFSVVAKEKSKFCLRIVWGSKIQLKSRSALDFNMEELKPILKTLTNYCP